MRNLHGNLVFENHPSITSYASVAGKKEGEGPLHREFDRVVSDCYASRETFEQAESELTRMAVQLALDKAGLTPREIQTAFCGDLLNQCVASRFALSDFGVPYAGIYGACSTMGLGLILAAMAVECGAAEKALCAASSHYCTAERQYRFPLEYGSQRPPTAQWTVTGAGACLLRTQPPDREASASRKESPTHRDPSLRIPRVAAARLGRIIDFAVTDQNNMGAAMAPAIVK